MPDRRPIRILRLFNGQFPGVTNNDRGLRSDWWTDAGAYLEPALDGFASQGYRRILLYAPAGRLYRPGPMNFDVYSSAQWETLPQQHQSDLAALIRPWTRRWSAELYVYLGHRIADPASLAMDDAVPPAHVPDPSDPQDLAVLQRNFDGYLAAGLHGFFFDNMSANAAAGTLLLDYLAGRGAVAGGEAIPRDGGNQPDPAYLGYRWMARGNWIRGQDPTNAWRVDPYRTEVIAAVHSDDSDGYSQDLTSRGFVAGNYHADRDVEVLADNHAKWPPRGRSRWGYVV